MAECLLCGDYETEHEETTPGSRFLGRCRVRHYHGCAKDDYEPCLCPGYEGAEMTNHD